MLSEIRKKNIKIIKSDFNEKISIYKKINQEILDKISEDERQRKIRDIKNKLSM